MDTDRKSVVAIIGAGIVGLMAALEIQRTGRDVIVIDRGTPGGRQSASYGNAGWIGSTGLLPVSMPGLWRKVPGFLVDRSGPLVIRPAYLPHVLPWLLRFVGSGRSWDRVERCAAVRFELCRESPHAHELVAAEAGVSHLIERKGQIILYRDRADYLADGLIWRIRKRFGATYNELADAELHALEPNISARYRCGVWVEGSHCTDVEAYCQAIAGLIRARGGTFIQAQATDFVSMQGRLQAVKTEDAAIECTHAVVAAGIGSKRLALAAGDRVPLESERGYHIVIADAGCTISHPVMPADGKMGITPTRRGLRVAGQVEFAGLEAAPDWRRADILRDWVARVFDRPLAHVQVVDRWMGHRPSTADGLPCIGAARACRGVRYGFGHGHSGFTQAPATAHLLAALLERRDPDYDVSALSAGRF